ncbi:MAG: MerR family transcriptional regulator [Flavobacteriales bacterium]|nr:MerR family transcriptional regulator [Flavobacteriales bacterium]
MSEIDSEKTSNKLYYSIGEVSKMFDVNPSLIRFWEKEFSIIKPKKNKKGNRLFTKKDVDNLTLIYHLVKEKGYTLDGAKKKMRENKDEKLDEVEMLKSLKKIKAFLESLKSEL